MQLNKLIDFFKTFFETGIGFSTFLMLLAILETGAYSRKKHSADPEAYEQHWFNIFGGIHLILFLILLAMNCINVVPFHYLIAQGFNLLPYVLFFKGDNIKKICGDTIPLRKATLRFIAVVFEIQVLTILVILMNNNLNLANFYLGELVRGLSIYVAFSRAAYMDTISKILSNVNAIDRPLTFMDKFYIFSLNTYLYFTYTINNHINVLLKGINKYILLCIFFGAGLVLIHAHFLTSSVGILLLLIASITERLNNTKFIYYVICLAFSSIWLFAINLGGWSYIVYLINSYFIIRIFWIAFSHRKSS